MGLSADMFGAHILSVYRIQPAEMAAMKRSYAKPNGSALLTTLYERKVVFPDPAQTPFLLITDILRILNS